jgi:hypothetical protein
MGKSSHVQPLCRELLLLDFVLEQACSLLFCFMTNSFPARIKGLQ